MVLGGEGTGSVKCGSRGWELLYTKQSLYVGKCSAFTFWSMYWKKNRCIVMQILHCGREPVTVRLKNEVYDDMFLARREKLLLSIFVTT